MAQLVFSVGKKNQKPVELSATIPALSKHDLNTEVPYEIRLPNGKIVKGKLDSPLKLMIAQATIQVQHATRDLLFPDPTKPAASSNGGYKE